MNETAECRKCPHKEIGTFEEVSASIDEYISNMDEDLCIDTENYNRRLKACFLCDSLYQKATCKFCGCFVRIRAKLKDQTCPYPGCSKWD